MRSIALLVGLCSVVCFGQEAAALYELFVDRGEQYVRAGTHQGLEQGAMVTLWGDLIPTTTERRRAGTATVMEIWPSLARVSLDDAAKSDKAAKKYASFEPKRRAGTPAVSPPPPPAPVAAADGNAAGAAAGILRGRATFNGAGPWMVLTLWNDERFDWTKCTLTLPGNLVYTLPHLKAGDRESIALSNFAQVGPEREAVKESVTVRCTQGASRFLFPTH